jgi:hypothetical protein
MTYEEKVKENYCRRWAKRLGLTLHKSRAKKKSKNNLMGYMIRDQYSYFCIAGSLYDLNLDQVAKFLEEYEKDSQKIKDKKMDEPNLDLKQTRVYFEHGEKKYYFYLDELLSILEELTDQEIDRNQLDEELNKLSIFTVES